MTDLQSVSRISYHGTKDMVAVIAGATLSESVANEAARLLSLIIESMHIVEDDGHTVTYAFAATSEVHDTLCVWASDAEHDEDDGTAEEDFRTHPQIVVAEGSACWEPAPSPFLISPAPRIGGLRAAARIARECNHAGA